MRPFITRSLTALCMAATLGGVGALHAAPSALDALSARETAGGLKGALSQGIDKAVSQLGAPNGFLSDPKVAIPLPPALEKAEGALRLIGLGGQADELKTTMNHAAEQAVAQARPVFRQALQHMSIEDAKGILTGGDGAATRYFRRATHDQLVQKFKPIVAQQTARLGLAARYDEYAGKAAQLGLLSAQDANLNDYVTARALDALYSRIGEEEHAIRQDPLGAASSLVKKVFSAL